MRPSFTTLGRWLGVAALLAVSAQPALAQRNVTLRMNSATMPDTIAADQMASGLQVRGQLDSGTALPDGNTIDWNDNTTLLPQNEGGDYWNISFQIPDDDRLQFKFYFDQSEQAGIGGWEDGDNYEIAAGTGDVTLDLHYFNKTGGTQPYDWRPFESDANNVSVWFRVYMKTEDAIGKGYDESDGATEVGVRGDNATGGTQDGGTTTVDWGSTNIVLTREASDSTVPGYNLFSGRVDYPVASVGQSQAYKFVFSDSDTDIGWEEDTNGGNRTFTIPAADTTLHWKFFSNSPAVDEVPVTANTTFQVDVAPLAQAGIFQAGADQMQLRGGFNGWDCPEDNQDDCLLQQQPFSTVYSREFPITSIEGSEAQYKFYLDFDEDYATDVGWEEPLDNGGSNRTFVFSGNEETVGPKLYNDVRADNVVADGRTVNVTFQVDMTRAMDFQPRGFDPAVDTVAVQFEDPVWLVTQGYEPGDPRLIQNGDPALIAGFTLEDPDGDMIYTGSFPVSGPTYNGIGYRHTFANDTDGIVTEGTGGFEEGRRRYRYITGSGNSFTFALDAFRDPLNEKTPWEGNPTGDIDPASDTFQFDIANGAQDPLFVAGEEAPRSVEGALSLSAAYPNPVNGIARMKVAVERDAAVSIRVYDVTGRQVAVIADGFQTIGEREVTLDVSDLSSGVYVVRAQAGPDVVTRRLTVTR